MNKTAETVLQMRDISVRSDGEQLFSNLSFALQKGEIHAVVGMATHELRKFVDLLSGDLSDYSGQCFLLGEPARFCRKERRIDVVRQGANQFPYLSAAENIFLTKTGVFRLKKRQELRRCEELLEQFQIKLDLRKKVREMAREDRKMLEFLRAYIKNCPIVVLSEPFLDIDKDNRGGLLNILREMKQRGQSIVFVTSHLDDALHISDRISVLDDGLIKITAKTEDVIKNPKEIMYMLSGWAPLQRDSRDKEWDILQTIVNARDILSSSSELKKELLYLAKDITKVLGAQNSVIYLLNEEVNGVIDTIRDNETKLSVPSLKSDAICRLVCEGNLVILSGQTAGYEALFQENREIRTIVCMPVNRNEQISGLIQVSFRENRLLSETDERYLKTFGKEIAIAIETSNLIGRSMLLQESHHRIKNNLQMITSMIYMQKLHYKEKGGDIDEIFQSIISRISSIAIVHNLLAKDKNEGSIVNLYNIVKEVIKIYERDDVRINLDVENISIPYNKATQISLVVNELICNCMKHAFQGRKDNVIRVFCHNDGKNIQLIIADNGCGLKNREQMELSGSIGVSVVKSIIAGLHGTVDFANNAGTTVRILFPTSHVYDARNSKD
ncbi:histidine kinase dimerization/phosphoacceptor domain -containing protein [Agathobaculum sp. NTUH-O15-33]|uniref:histidine kinase dimerization/phosphoacceptor domain -containing protein n=1 Tax=Agathobaculum sp. NTUH-O15-33 TaxID=3079302 RepID=UPI002958A53F|nr:histidine kinase dimerization/phosphoacceptor domain -containing protein [Agathobaculum sp. NTUH-O15-33]WNX83447.1 histidine kinase dimerization/phosphoacceptor domain -containing protein [Agathobaculum sp. NTUH-O15-33]